MTLCNSNYQMTFMEFHNAYFRELRFAIVLSHYVIFQDQILQCSAYIKNEVVGTLLENRVFFVLFFVDWK